MKRESNESSPTLMETIYRRRAVRSYTGQRVDPETIHTLLKAAIQAPTAIHAEPWAFAVIQDEDLLKRISDRAKAAQLASLGEDLKAAAYRPMLENPDFNIFYNAGTLIVIFGVGPNAYVAADCWLAAENLMLAACAMGLGTCPIGFALPALQLAEVKSELGIPADMVPVAPIILGMPSGPTPSMSRKPPRILCWK